MSVLLFASLLRSLHICPLGLLSNLVPNLVLNLSAYLQVFSSASLFICLPNSLLAILFHLFCLFHSIQICCCPGRGRNGRKGRFRLGACRCRWLAFLLSGLLLFLQALLVAMKHIAEEENLEKIFESSLRLFRDF